MGKYVEMQVRVPKATAAGIREIARLADVSPDQAASVIAVLGLREMVMPKVAEPIAWVTDESLRRLKRGGNGSRGTVPVHTKPSAVAKHPLTLSMTAKDPT